MNSHDIYFNIICWRKKCVSKADLQSHTVQHYEAHSEEITHSLWQATGNGHDCKCETLLPSLPHWHLCSIHVSRSSVQRSQGDSDLHSVLKAESLGKMVCDPVVQLGGSQPGEPMGTMTPSVAE